ncbi:PAS-domain containing protein [Roseibium sp. RKSG952]|uniref:PAS-domain containing protein n=1 Tax=Roseibium sp. RKSG952 TaxID=2529384 RepID=UPI0012BC9507|nr:PAS-domain containing protein [Roseibium sp. RKSG952]MTH99762.1 response regulator [Roseibium sp. RKSG952]
MTDTKRNRLKVYILAAVLLIAIISTGTKVGEWLLVAQPEDKSGPILRGLSAVHATFSGWPLGAAGLLSLVLLSVCLTVVRPRPVSASIWERDAEDLTRADLIKKVKLYENIFESIDQGVVACDEDLRLVAFNNRFRDLRLYPDSPVFVGQNLEAIIRFDAERGEFGAVDVEETVSQSLERARGNERHALERRRPNGSWIEISGGPLPGGGFVSTFTDITERVTAREKLLQQMEALEEARRETLKLMEEAVTSRERAEQLRQKAESATKAKDSFLAVMSHEIRTPMNGIIGMIDILGHTSLEPDQRQMTATIRESAVALLTIINDILDYSKIEAGKLELERIPVSISDTLDGVSEMMGPSAGLKGLGFVSYCDPDIPTEVYGDPVRLRQILYNLIGNAVKFTDKGRIVIRADLQRLSGTQAAVRYRVEDNGIGMAPEQVAKLFQPFQQADATTTRKFGGTGLGLSIVRRLVDMMGGRVDVQSTLGEGSCFSLTLVHDIVEGARPDVMCDLDGVRLLCLVPDDDLRRLLFRRYLGPHGARLDFVHDAARLVATAHAAALQGRGYDAVFLAVDYDDCVKSDLLEKFKGDENLARIPFVVARRMAEIGTGSRMDGVTIVPSAPLTRRKLVAAIAIALGRENPEAETAMQPAVSRRREPPSVEEAIANNELILVVEDNKTNQDVIRRQLHLLGYQSEIAENGEEGLEAIRSGRFAIALSDVHMPRMDGFEMTAQVRQDESAESPHFPIIAITANALQGDLERCRRAGMDDYLAKPLEMAKLQAMLQRWLPDAGKDQKAPASQDLPSAPAHKSAEPPATAQDDTKPVDLSALTELFGDDHQTIREMLTEFVVQAVEISSAVRAAVEQDSAEDVTANCHKLKSSARAVGAYALSEVCLKLERAGKQNDWQTIGLELPKLHCETRAISEQIRQL